MSAFNDFFISLGNLGFADSLLPFFLIFTIVFATLEKTHIIGEGKKRFNILIAFVLGFIVVLPHLTNSYPANRDVVEIINNALPNIALILVAIVALLLLLGLFHPSANISGTGLGMVLSLLSIVAVVFFFGQAAQLWGEIKAPAFEFLNDPDVQAVLIIVLVFGLVLYFITRDDSGSANVGGGVGRFFNGLRDAISPK